MTLHTGVDLLVQQREHGEGARLGMEQGGVDQGCPRGCRSNRLLQGQFGYCVLVRAIKNLQGTHDDGRGMGVA